MGALTVEKELAALSVSGLRKSAHKSAGVGSFRSTTSCKSTNGAYVSRGSTNHTALVGRDSEDLTIDAATKLPSVARNGIPPVEQRLGTAFEADSDDEPGAGFATIEVAVEAIKQGKVCQSLLVWHISGVLIAIENIVYVNVTDAITGVNFMCQFSPVVFLSCRFPVCVGRGR